MNRFNAIISFTIKEKNGKLSYLIGKVRKMGREWEVFKGLEDGILLFIHENSKQFFTEGYYTCMFQITVTDNIALAVPVNFSLINQIYHATNPEIDERTNSSPAQVVEK